MQFLWKYAGARDWEDVCPEGRKDPILLLHEMREEHAEAKEKGEEPEVDEGIP